MTLWSGIIAFEGRSHALDDGRFLEGLEWPEGPVPLRDLDGNVIGETISISRIGDAILAEFEVDSAFAGEEIFPNISIDTEAVTWPADYPDCDPWPISGKLNGVLSAPEDNKSFKGAYLRPLRPAGEMVSGEFERHVPASELDDANTDSIAAAFLEYMAKPIEGEPVVNEWEGVLTVEGVPSGDNRFDPANATTGDEFEIDGERYRVNDLGHAINITPVPDGFDDWNDVDAFQQQCKSTMAGAADTMWYCALGMGNEVGELQGKIKKLYRDDAGLLTEERRNALRGELSDAMWYLTMVATHAGLSMSECLAYNVGKVRSRAERGKLKGDGDNR